MVKTPKDASLSRKSYDFFKVYLPQHSAHQLVLPPAFISNLDGGLPKNATLMDHTGKQWHVDLKLDENKNVLVTKNWQNFVSFHSLQFGDFLVFNFDGDSSFDVQIFGKNGCKKDFGYGKNTCVLAEKEQKGVNLDMAPYTPKPFSCQESQKPVLRKAKTPIGLRGAKISKSKLVDKRIEPACVKPRNPYFLRSITMSSNYRMSVPPTMLDSYGIGLKSDVKLIDHTRRKWPIKVNFADCGRVYLSTGWNTFSKHHGLEKDNKCLFEFVLDKRNDCRELRVQIIRGDLPAEIENDLQVTSS